MPWYIMSDGAQSLGVKPSCIQLCQTGAQGLGMKPGCIQIENLVSLRSAKVTHFCCGPEVDIILVEILQINS